MQPRLLAELRNPLLPAPLGGSSIAEGGVAVGGLIGAVVGGMLIFGFIIAMIYLITGAFHWITSGGDKTNLENARNKIIHAIVGLVVLASVWAVMTLIGQFLGIEFPDLKLPTIPGTLDN